MDIVEGYRQLVEAARGGANVTKAAEIFNRYINSQALPPEFEKALADAIAEKNAAFLQTAAVWAAAVAAAAVLAYVLARRWREVVGLLWLYIWRNAKLTKGRGTPQTLLYDQEVLAVLAAVAVVAIAAAVGIAIKPQEPFSAIALLGPGGKIGGYPTTAKPGSPINLNIYVYNREGAPVWYVVYVKVDNSTAQPPLPTPPLLTAQKLLLNNQSWIFPISLTLGEKGRWRIVAELWKVETNGTLTYTGRWVQLWINVS